MSGVDYRVHRICIYNNGQPPINFPKENQKVCSNDLCNGEAVRNASGTPQGPIEKPISCYSCLNCTKNNQEVKNMCGGCLTVTSSGLQHKYCGPTCNQVLNHDEVSCCSTSFCNGMIKLSTQQSSIISVLIITAISGYIL
ncbi:hypothetical protein KSF78_0000499 [Schistosoma japonicum]|nr:SJCHGC05578 protein [Schistosoma japonicum]KAH8850355.1 hypothetical protein KSF78_0000499 [Schistosoma japonicum]